MSKIALLLPLLLLTGCGPATTDVAGTITYQGKTVVTGTVMLIDSSGEPKYGSIQPDGTFTVTGVIVGPVKCAVSSPCPPGATPPKVVVKSADVLDGLDGRKPADANATSDPAVIKGWFPLPEQLGDPTSSGLTFDITAGQPLILNLK